MTRPRTLMIVSMLALMIAGTASFLAYSFLKKQAVPATSTMAVVTAAADIPIGTKLDPAYLKLTPWPKEALSPGYATDLGKLTGRVAIRSLSAGDLVTEPKLLPLNRSATGGIMTYLIPQGHRAVTAAVNEVAGVAGFITPGSKVDVVVTTPSPSNKDENVSKIILENVPVLATGQVTDQRGGKPVVVPTVTLDLTPEDAEKLVVSATNKGSLQPLQLLLRNIADGGHAQSRGATIAKVLNGIETPVTKKKGPERQAPRPKEKPTLVVKAAPPPTFTLEIVRGSEKSTRHYTE